MIYNILYKIKNHVEFILKNNLKLYIKIDFSNQYFNLHLDLKF